MMRAELWDLESIQTTRLEMWGSFWISARPVAFEVGAIPGANGAIAFGVGNGGYVVGSSMMNQGSGMPFIWSDADGIVAIPLATGTSEGSARGVNSSGWVVGQDSSAFSIPFLWDGTTTYRLADLLPPGSGWDLDMNTSSSAAASATTTSLSAPAFTTARRTPTQWCQCKQLRHQHQADTHTSTNPSPTPTPSSSHRARTSCSRRSHGI